MSQINLSWGGRCESLGYFSAGSCFQARNLWVLFIFPPSYVALQDLKTSPRPASARVSWCLETSSITTPFLGRISVPSSFVSLFIFYILSYLLSKTMGCFSGCLMSSASDQKLFCEVCSAFNCSLDEFVRGESGLPVLFLHRRVSSPFVILIYKEIQDSKTGVQKTYV